MRGGRSHCKAGHQSIRGHTGLAILRCLSTNMTGIANTDEALTCVKLLISGTPYSSVRELIVLSLVYRWKNGRFGKLNSSSWVAQVVCDGTCAGTQVVCYSPREWSRKSGCRGLACYAPECDLHPELFRGFQTLRHQQICSKEKKEISNRMCKWRKTKLWGSWGRDPQEDWRPLWLLGRQFENLCSRQSGSELVQFVVLKEMGKSRVGAPDREEIQVSKVRKFLSRSEWGVMKPRTGTSPGRGAWLNLRAREGIKGHCDISSLGN